MRLVTEKVAVVCVTAMLAALAAACPAWAAPGDLISATPAKAQVLPGVPLPGTAWKITYASTSAEGAPVQVTGMVLIPPGPATAKRPLVGYAIGSQGLADRCAASSQLEAGSEYEAALVEDAVRRGWVVALTDYPGLGTPGEHTYAVGRANGPAVLDSMRAARKLPAAAVSAGTPLGLFGYSEGGGAAGAAVEMQPRYAPDLPLRGAVVGGVIADLPRTADYINGGPVAFLLMYAASGLDASYPELRLQDGLNARGRSFLKQMRGSCLQEAIPTAPFAHMSDFTNQDLLHRADWDARMRENTLGQSAPDAPVLLAHARGDEVLPFDAAVALDKRWCALGADVEFRELVLPEHVLSAFENSGPAFDWLGRRLSGAGATNGCNPQRTAATPAPASPKLTVRITRVSRKRVAVRVTTTAGVRSLRISARDDRRRLGLTKRFAARPARHVTLKLRRARRGARITVTVRATTIDGRAISTNRSARVPR